MSVFAERAGWIVLKVVFKNVSSSQPDQIWGIEARERSCREHYNDRQNYRRFPAFETLSGLFFLLSFNLFEKNPAVFSDYFPDVS